MEEAILKQTGSPADTASSKTVEPGKLKIFFGYAAGVGKTYAMLEAAHQAQNEGIDVVCGYVERHTRPDTLALLDGLEVLPCREMEYHGIRLQEFDLDSALKRCPKLILVDELAHTNAVGSRHTKRYQDVEELLHAGIDVYTSMNVQHLESLNDLVSSITGVVVNERVPDHVFDRASQVELVDIEPADLVKRLKAGKVYKEKQAKKALENFFTVENLAALREIAMRRTADLLNRAAVQSGKPQSARAGEHILICLSGAPSNAKVIRTAARMAEAFHSGFTALLVQTPETKELSEESRKRLQNNIRLAEQLGAQISTVYGTEPAEQIAEYARVSGVTKIIMGRRNHNQNLLSGKKSLADRLLELTDLDVYIIPDKQPLYKKPMRRFSVRSLSFSRKDALSTVGILIFATLICFLFFEAGFSDSNLITVYILGVLLIGVVTNGPLYSAVGSFLSVGAFNFFFIDPRFSFEAYDASYPITFLITLLSGMIAGSLASRVKSQARLAAQKSYYTELLLGSSQKLQKGRDEWDCLHIAAEQLNRLFDRPILYAVDEADKELSFRAEPMDQSALADGLSAGDLGVAKWVQKNNKHAGATTSTLPESRWLFLSVRGSQGVMGIVGIPIAEYGAPDAFEKNLMIAILSECGLSQERIRLERERNEAAMRLQKEELQSVLLKAVSQDLRMPLANIHAAAGQLMEAEQTVSEEQREQMYTGIYDDSGWLINMTENIAASARIENGKPLSGMKTVPVLRIFRDAVQKLNLRTEDHVISIDLSDEELKTKVKYGLILRVVINIVSNAIQYTPAGTAIRLNAFAAGSMVEVVISDDGPGISPEGKRHLFDLFYTADQEKSGGTRGLGLGLHLCRSIIRQHGGEIEVSDRKPRGTRLRFTLPAADEV